MAANKHRFSQPLNWHGGKFYLAKRIIEMIPQHTHYVEPFFGGGAVFFKKPVELIENHSEVVNDIYAELINFWKVLQSESLFPKFERSVNLTPFAKPIWQESLTCESTDPVDRAVAFFVRFRQSRQGLGKGFATMAKTMTRRAMNAKVSAWLSAIESLPETHERLKRVAIFSENAGDVIRREDGVSTFYYCDPPYVHQTRVSKKVYSHEMSDDQHVQLLETLGNIKGKFILSGYPSQMYNDAAKRFNWNRKDVLIPNSASSQKSKPIMTECLWYNF